MRQHDRGIQSIEEIEAIIREADVCRLGLSDNNVPYVVAMNFGYVGGARPVFYFHCADEGKKIDIIRKNNTVCFHLDTGHELIRADAACGWGMKYKSVTGMGKAELVDSREEKIAALNAIMKHYSGADAFEFSGDQLTITAIIKLTVTEMSGKKKG